MSSKPFASALPRFPPVAEVLGTVSAGALDPLVRPAVRERIIEMARAFPVEAQTVCYECRLSEQDDRVDLALCLFPSLTPAAQKVIERLHPLHGPEPEWRRCLDFLREWTAPGSSFTPRVPFVWVAFDLDREFPALPTPCLGLCVDPSFLAKRLGAPAQDTPLVTDLEALAEDCFRRFHDQSLPAPLASLLRRCLASDNVEPRHFSFMLGRAPATFKLDVQLPLAEVAALLRRIDWPGPPQALESKIRAFMPWNQRVQLNLVLHPRLAPPLEVELLTVPSEVTLERRETVLGELVAAGLCSADKARVLREAASGSSLRTGSDARVGRGWYVKVRFQEDRAVEAKAYLGLMPQLWPQPFPREVHTAPALE